VTSARRCATCGRPEPEETARWRCACGGPWALEPVGVLPPRTVLLGRPRSLWRYREALPVTGPPVTLGEGMTPMVPSRDGRLQFKLESANPTGSFNAGAAIAAYSARAGIRATIYVPEAASPGKLGQIAAYGAHLVHVAGTREDVAHAAQTGPGLYASHCWNPLFFHGTKTIAFELWEQLGGRAPDWVVSPVGHGTLLLGLALGFRELVAAGAIARLPRLVGVQSAACAPLAGPPLGRPTGAGDTVAEGIRVRSPVRAGEIRAAVIESGGRWAVVEEAGILAAQAHLGVEGLFVEPTAAVAAAAAPLRRRERRPPST